MTDVATLAEERDGLTGEVLIDLLEDRFEMDSSDAEELFTRTKMAGKIYSDDGRFYPVP